jgi:peptidoglycan/xylan/chitin deacetylase (PgdA/CDA1 family)
LARTLALTFDDGPSSEGTEHLLELLASHAVMATFFVCGDQASKHPAVVRDVLDAGHSLQPHCWEHVSHWTLEPGAIAADIDRVLDQLKAIGVPRPTLWRPPYGHVRREVTRAIAAERGLALVGWTINPHDYAGHDAAQMLAGARAQLDEQEHAVLLLHDGHREPRQPKRRLEIANTIELVALLLDAPELEFAPMVGGLEDSLAEGPVPPGSA